MTPTRHPKINDQVPTLAAAIAFLVTALASATAAAAPPAPTWTGDGSAVARPTGVATPAHPTTTRATRAACVSCPQPGHWMFQQSYYSHELAAAEWDDPILPSPRSQLRVPTVGTNPGFSVRSRYRVNTFVLRNGLNSFDVTYQRQGNVEIQP